MQPNKVLSKPMHVRPLKNGEFVIYRLIKADEISPNIVDKDDVKITNNPSWSTAKFTWVNDLELGQKVQIGNVTGLEAKRDDKGNITNPPVYTEKCTPAKFNPNCRVDYTANATYEFLERHDANLDNPFRDQSKPPKFYRVDVKKRALTENNKNAILADALSWINTCNHTEVKAINASLPDGKKLNMDSDYEVIKSELFKLTKEDPIMVMKASTHRQAIAKIVVMECEFFQIILWEEGDRKWFFNNEKQEDITTIDIGKNRIDGMVDFFKTDEGKKMYMRLTTRLRMFLNNGSPNKN